MKLPTNHERDVYVIEPDSDDVTDVVDDCLDCLAIVVARDGLTLPVRVQIGAALASLVLAREALGGDDD